MAAAPLVEEVVERGVRVAVHRVGLGTLMVAGRRAFVGGADGSVHPGDQGIAALGGRLLRQGDDARDRDGRAVCIFGQVEHQPVAAVLQRHDRAVEPPCVDPVADGAVEQRVRRCVEAVTFGGVLWRVDHRVGVVHGASLERRDGSGGRLAVDLRIGSYEGEVR